MQLRNKEITCSEIWPHAFQRKLHSGSVQRENTSSEKLLLPSASSRSVLKPCITNVHCTAQTHSELSSITSPISAISAGSSLQDTASGTDTARGHKTNLKKEMKLSKKVQPEKTSMRERWFCCFQTLLVHQDTWRFHVRPTKMTHTHTHH